MDKTRQILKRSTDVNEMPLSLDLEMEMAKELERLKVETGFRFPPVQKLWLGG